MDCKLCDYYSSLGGGSETSMCDFADVLFFGDVEKLDMEYPCRNLSYDDYLDRTSKLKSYSRFVNDDWRYVYRRGHLTGASGRTREAAGTKTAAGAALPSDSRENVESRYARDDWRLVYRRDHLNGTFVSTLHRAV